MRAQLFQSNRIPLDVALIHVSPPDAHGYCSLGCSVDVAESAVQCATTVIAQVCLRVCGGVRADECVDERTRFLIAQFNKNMPRTHGDGLIHMSNIDVALEVNDEIPGARCVCHLSSVVNIFADLMCIFFFLKIKYK